MIWYAPYTLHVLSSSSLRSVWPYPSTTERVFPEILDDTPEVVSALMGHDDFLVCDSEDYACLERHSMSLAVEPHICLSS